MLLRQIRATGGTRGWSPPGPDEGDALILFRSGLALRRAEGHEALVDASGGYVSVDGVEERMAFPVGGAQLCTLIGLLPEGREEHLHRLPTWHVTTTTAVDLRHRSLLAACARGIDIFEVDERLYWLLASVAAPFTTRPGHRPLTEEAHLRLVTTVQEALSGGHLTAGLDALAALAGSSPHHLSRVFRRMTGRTLTDYRNELRVRAVLEDLTAGASDLAALSVRYGFADQPHLTRMVKHYAETTPAALRRELSMNLQDQAAPSA